MHAPPDVFAPVPNAWGEQGWTTLTLSKATIADVRAALEMAWAHAVPQPSPGHAALHVDERESGPQISARYLQHLLNEPGTPECKP